MCRCTPSNTAESASGCYIYMIRPTTKEKNQVIFILSPTCHRKIVFGDSFIVGSGSILDMVYMHSMDLFSRGTSKGTNMVVGCGRHLRDTNDRWIKGYIKKLEHVILFKKDLISHVFFVINTHKLS